MRGEITVLGQSIQIRYLPPITPAQLSTVQPMSSNFNNLPTMKWTYKSESKYKFTRANWYVADFNWNNYDEVYAWCTQQFGPEPPISRQDAWTRWMHKYGDKIHFRDEKDYVWFMLRWS